MKYLFIFIFLIFNRIVPAQGQDIYYAFDDRMKENIFTLKFIDSINIELIKSTQILEKTKFSLKPTQNPNFFIFHPSFKDSLETALLERTENSNYIILYFSNNTKSPADFSAVIKDPLKKFSFLMLYLNKNIDLETIHQYPTLDKMNESDFKTLKQKYAEFDNLLNQLEKPEELFEQFIRVQNTLSFLNNELISMKYCPPTELEDYRTLAKKLKEN